MYYFSTNIYIIQLSHLAFSSSLFFLFSDGNSLMGLRNPIGKTSMGSILKAHSSLTGENQADFRTTRECIDRCFPQQWIVEHWNVFHRSTTFIFSQLKMAIDSDDSTIFMANSNWRMCQEKIIPCLQFRCTTNRSWICAYYHLTYEFNTRIGVR